MKEQGPEVFGDLLRARGRIKTTGYSPQCGPPATSTLVVSCHGDGAVRGIGENHHY